METLEDCVYYRRQLILHRIDFILDFYIAYTLPFKQKKQISITIFFFNNKIRTGISGSQNLNKAYLIFSTINLCNIAHLKNIFIIMMTIINKLQRRDIFGAGISSIDPISVRSRND